MTLEILLEGFATLEILGIPNMPDMSVELNQKIWLDALVGLSEDDFMRAINILSKILKYGPIPSQIIEAANKGKTLPASFAFQMLEDEITRVCGTDIHPGPMTPAIWKVVNLMGGDLNIIWKRDDRSFVRNEFIKHYNEIVSSDKMITGGDVKELEGK